MKTPMTAIRIFLVVSCMLWVCDGFAQHFVAKDGSGELNIINENQYEISFYSISGADSEPEASFFDTGYYRISNDTMFLTSKTLTWADIVTTYDTSRLERLNEASYLIQNFGVNLHGKWYEQYKYIVRDVYRKGDTIVLYCPRFLSRGCILSVYDNYIQRRVIPNKRLFFSYQKEPSFYVIIYPDNVDRIYLDNFPVLIRGKKIIPIDENKNFECFVYNGFGFPKMDNKNRTINKIGVMSRGKRIPIDNN